jgi:hypothetical protein
MTDYTATPEQWAAAEYYADPARDPRPLSEYACILELRARIEALEAVRPKPPSLAEEALAEIQLMEGAMYSADLGCDFTATRRALERLQELEGGNG